MIIIAIVRYNLLTILKLQHDILRSLYRQIIKVQNPNLRIFSPPAPCLFVSPSKPTAARLILQMFAKYFSMYTEKSFNNYIALLDFS